MSSKNAIALLRRATPPALIALLACAGSAGAAQQDPISVELGPFSVSSHGSSVVWSHFSEEPGLYELMTLRDGQRETLPVRPSPRPFDVDLGTSRSGATVAVYSRCAKLPTRPQDRGTRCDLYQLDLAANVEKKLTRLSSSSADESQPTIFRGDVAFVRKTKREWQLRLNDQVLVRLPVKRGAILDPQLSRTRLAYTVADPGSGFGRKTVRVRTLGGGRDRAIYQARSGGANAADVTRSSWNDRGSELYFARTNEGSGRGNRYVRWSAATGKLSYARGTSRAQSTSWAGGAIGMFVGEALTDGACFANDRDPNRISACRLIATGTLAFNAGP
jgi:hypothetical protein